MNEPKKQSNSPLSDIDSFEGSTLDARTIIDAVDRLKYGDTQVLFPDDESHDTSWQVAMSLAFLRLFRVRLSSRAPTNSQTLQPHAMFRMTIPLRRHSIDVAQSFSDLELLGRFGSMTNNQLELKYRFSKELVQTGLSVVEQWIDIAKNGTTYTVKDILRISNIEQRMSALKIMGADRLLQEAHAELISKSKRGNELYKIPASARIFSEDAYFLKYACVSTGRIYVSGVPPQLFDLRKTIMGSLDSAFSNDLGALQFFGASTTLRQRGQIDMESKYYRDYPKKAWADLAMAWKFRLSLEEYLNLIPENEG